MQRPFSWWSIPLRLIGGAEKHAVVSGKTVAWLCVCGHIDPIVALRKPERPAGHAQCRVCLRTYALEANAAGDQTVQVRELARAAASSAA